MRRPALWAGLFVELSFLGDQFGFVLFQILRELRHDVGRDRHALLIWRGMETVVDQDFADMDDFSVADAELPFLARDEGGWHGRRSLGRDFGLFFRCCFA